MAIYQGGEMLRFPATNYTQIHDKTKQAMYIGSHIGTEEIQNPQEIFTDIEIISINIRIQSEITFVRLHIHAQFV